MKRIETLTEGDRLAIVRTLNAAAINGESAYICPGCCAGRKRTFIGWLTWLLDEVEKTEISSGLHVFCTSDSNHFCIERDDDLNFNKLYAQGRPLTALFFDKHYIKIIDVFASRNGVACIFVKDNRSGENVIYIDKDI